jgi:hypothetical protein
MCTYRIDVLNKEEKVQKGKAGLRSGSWEGGDAGMFMYGVVIKQELNAVFNIINLPLQ